MKNLINLKRTKIMNSINLSPKFSKEICKIIEDNTGIITFTDTLEENFPKNGFIVYLNDFYTDREGIEIIEKVIEKLTL